MAPRDATGGVVVLVAATGLGAAWALLPWTTAGFLTVLGLWSTYLAVRGVRGGRPLVVGRRCAASRSGGTGVVGDVAGFGEQLGGSARRYGHTG